MVSFKESEYYSQEKRNFQFTTGYELILKKKDRYQENPKNKATKLSHLVKETLYRTIKKIPLFL